MQYSAFKSFSKKNRKLSKHMTKVNESPVPMLEGGLQPNKHHHIAIQTTPHRNPNSMMSNYTNATEPVELPIEPSSM